MGLGTALRALRLLQPGPLDASNTVMKAHIAGRPGNLLLATLGETSWNQRFPSRMFLAVGVLRSVVEAKAVQSEPAGFCSVGS